jgi:hypothetical protein
MGTLSSPTIMGKPWFTALIGVSASLPTSTSIIMKQKKIGVDNNAINFMQKRILVKKQSGSPKILNFRNLKGTRYRYPTFCFFSSRFVHVMESDLPGKPTCTVQILRKGLYCSQTV